MVFSLLVGWFWQNKGLSFWGGVGLSLILSPLIGFIIGLLMRPDRKQQEAQQLAAGDVRKCPFCAEVIRAEAVVCRYCGRELPPAPPSIEASSPKKWRPPPDPPFDR